MSAKEFLKEYCKDKLNAGAVVLQILLAAISAFVGDYPGVIICVVLTVYIIVLRLNDMQYEALRRYTDELEKRHFELLDWLAGLCNQKEKGQGE